MPFSRSRFALLIVTACLQAQDPRGTITGRVTDQSGALVPNARVRVINEATQVAGRSTTNQAANFVVPFLIPGTYTITVEATGFKRLSRPGVQLRISETVEVDLQLELGALTE